MSTSSHPTPAAESSAAAEVKPHEVDREQREQAVMSQALEAYVRTLPQDERSALQERLMDDQVCLQMVRALAQMAALIGQAPHMQPDTAFLRLARRVLFLARTDLEEVHRLRVYHLDQREALGWWPALPSSDKQRFERRLHRFQQDLVQQHDRRAPRR